MRGDWLKMTQRRLQSASDVRGLFPGVTGLSTAWQQLWTATTTTRFQHHFAEKQFGKQMLLLSVPVCIKFFFKVHPRHQVAGTDVPVSST